MQYFDNDIRVESEEFIIKFDLFDKSYAFYSDNGVFAKTRLDRGSEAFLKVLIKEQLGNLILDLGSGIGVIGLVLSDIYPEKQFILAEINERAYKLSLKTQMQMKRTNTSIRLSDCFSAVPESELDSILLNPPIRAGKKVIYKMFDEAKIHLKEMGSLFIVMRKDQGAPSAVKYLSSLFEEYCLLQRDKGYYVYKFTKKIQK